MLGTRLFISHSSEDKPFIINLAEDLKSFAGHVWVDIWELRVGDSLKDRLKTAIHENDFFAIVLSPRSVRSEWVKFELSEALVKELEDKKVFILPILLENCRIPKSIKGKIYADFRKEYESGLIAVLKAIVDDKNRLLQIENGFLGVHTDIPSVFLNRLQRVTKKVCLNAVFYPLFTFTAATQTIKQSIEQRKCHYEILFQNPSSKFIEYLTIVLRKGHTTEDFCKEIDTHIDIFKSLRENYYEYIELKWTESLPTFPMVIMDQRVFAGFYSYASPAPSGPWIELSKVGRMSSFFIQHYEEMWNLGEHI